MTTTSGPKRVAPVRPRPKPAAPPVSRPVAKPEVRPEQKRPPTKEEEPVKKPSAGPPAPPAEPRARELSPLAERVLDDELRRIMIEVWQALPDDPPCHVEKMIVDKLRNEAGDQLRDVLGLNVTKRMLNVFNPLNVKVHFTTKPDRKYLRQFLKQYNFVAFRRVARLVNTFAAQVKTVADFDRLCNRKDIDCGAAKITITPYYRFNQCPKNLKTVYDTLDDGKDIENTDTTDKDVEMREEGKTNVNISNVNNPTQNISKGSDEKVAQQKTITTKSVATSTSDEELTTNTNGNSKTDIGVKVTPNKAEPMKQLKTPPKPQVVNKPVNAQSTPTNEPTKAIQVNNTTPVETQTETIPASTQVKTNVTKTAPARPQAQNNVTPVKTQPKVVPKPNIEQKTEFAKPQPKADLNKAKVVEPIKATVVEPKAKVVEPKAKVVEPIKATVVDPKAKVVEPKAKVVEPKAKVVEPKAKVVEPKAKVVEPKAKVVDPKAKVVEPKAKVVEPKAKVVEPKAKVLEPKAKVVEPAKPTVAKKTNVAAAAKNVKTVGNKTAAVVNSTKKVVIKTMEPAKCAKLFINSNKQKDFQKSFEEKDDFEELDDEDILALMSGGIVLDECSGSDLE